MKPRIFIICAIFIIIVQFCLISVSAKEEADDMFKQLELFADVITLIQANYIREVSPKDLIYGALRGMLTSLDVHSQFLDPDTYKKIKAETEGEFGGLGIVITIKDNILTIVSPIHGTPACRAGLRTEDKIIKIDGETTENITLIDAVKKLRGTPGAKVDLTILRKREIFEVTIVREIIKIDSVKDVQILKDNIGYIRLTAFQENTSSELGKALEELSDQGMDSLILDLRNNSGGLLNVAVSVTEKFLLPGKLIVYTKGREMERNLKFKSRSKEGYYDIPMVVLINRGSASGSEIVAGALQDNRRAILLGENTFGKASVQTIIPLTGGSALRLTTSKYFTPSGRSIHEKGIAPDILVKYERREEFQEKEELEKQIFREIEKEEFQEEKLKREIIEYDNQVSRAVDLLIGIKRYREIRGNLLPQ